MRHYLGTMVVVLLLTACQQQSPIEVDRSQTFSDQFADSVLMLDHDKGEEVRLVSRGASEISSRGIRGANDSYNSLSSCNSIYGCEQDPWSYWYGYTNYVHSWRPNYNHIVNMKFGQTYYYTAQDVMAASVQGMSSCWKLTISSNKKLYVLRFMPNTRSCNPQYDLCPLSDNSSGSTSSSESYYPYSYISGSGSNTLYMKANSVNGRGALIFAVEDNMMSGCNSNQDNWWDYGGYSYPICGGYYDYTTVQITGTGGACGSGTTVNLDLTPYMNNLYSSMSYYTMPYFHTQVGSGYSISGRVQEYASQYKYDYWTTY